MKGMPAGKAKPLKGIAQTVNFGWRPGAVNQPFQRPEEAENNEYTNCSNI